MSEKLPEYFMDIFWSYDISGLDARKNKRRIIVDTINYGGRRHWKWLLDNYGAQTIRGVLESVPATELRPRALRLASIIFSLKKQKYASRSAYAGRR